MNDRIRKHIEEHQSVVAEVAASEQIHAAIEESAQAAAKSLKNGGHVLFCGNGGSAADAQHYAAELSVRLEKDRIPLAGIALTTNTSVITAAGNDYSFDHIFSRQISAHGRKGDILVAISTSGSSRNIVKAIEAAKASGMIVFGLTGSGGGTMAGMCDHIVSVPTRRTMRVQEVHGILLHAWCELVERLAMENR